jgi:cell division protease FtsH
MVDAAYEKAKQILRDNRSKLEQLAKVLLEREVIFKEDLEQIFGKRPWDPEVVETSNNEPIAPTATLVTTANSDEEQLDNENPEAPVV